MSFRNVAALLGLGVALCLGTTAYGQIGPDVIVGELTGPGNYGTAGGYYAYSVGTTSCNLGDETLAWVASTNQHPVIAQHLYRLKDGRFEQIGISWLKHGFAALQGNICNAGCQPSGSGSALGVGCSDPYGAGLNASQGNGPRSEVNATTGDFPYPYVLNPPVTDTTSRRIRVQADDVDPALNPGATYYIEGQYVAPDDAMAGNHHNNSSYRQVNVSSTGFTLSFAGSTVREKAAIEAWPTVDPSVILNDLFVDGGRFILATKVTDLGNGFWDYEYALHNLNSDRSAGSFSIPVSNTAATQSFGFHDVEYHSGEPYSGLDWSVTTSASEVTWATEDFAVNPDANALRWGTLYNFRFQANVPPVAAVATVGLFKPGTPDSAVVPTLAPLGAGGSTPAPQALSCSASTFDADLSWTNAAAYDTLLVFRNGQQIATLPGGDTSYTDPSLPVGTYTYLINGVLGGAASPAASCDVDIVPPGSISGLSCTVNGFQSNLTWSNGDSYDSIEIRRNGSTVATLPGSDTSYNDLGLNVGSFTYNVTGVIQGVPSGAASCDIDVVPPPTLDFAYTAANQTVGYDAAGQASFLETISLQEDPASPNYPNDVSAFSAALAHDGAYLEATAIDPGAALSAMNGGSGPEFFAGFLYPDGVTAGVVFSLMVTETLQATTPLEVLSVSYDTIPGLLAGTNGVTTELEFVDNVLGNPPVLNTVVVGIGSNLPAFTNGSIDLVPMGSGNFVRGDSNGDGSINLVDVVYSLNYLFLNGPGDCLKAQDINDDGNVNLPDPVTLLGYLFLSGPDPVAPFPSCGTDPTPDSLGCGFVPSCP